MVSKARFWFQAGLVFLLAFVTFSPTLKVGFMLDDAFLVPRVQSEWTVASLKSDFTTNVHDDPSTYLYRPVQKMMVRLQYSISGTKPWGYHLLSLLFHAGNAVGVYLVAIALGAAPLAGLVAGAFYAVHPLIVDDLLAGTGGESMAVFFSLFALFGLLQEKRFGLQALGYGCYGLALLSKESAVVLPALLALLLWVSRRPPRSYWRILPLAVLWVPYAMMRAHAVGPLQGLDATLLSKFVSTAFPRISLYAVARVLVPWDLESWPAIPHMSRVWWLYGIGLVALLARLLYKKNRWGLFALGWFLLAFAMRSPAMILGEVVLDKWISFASIGLFIPLGVFFVRALDSSRSMGRSGWGALLVALAWGWGALSVWNIQLRGSDEKNYAWAMRDGFRDFAAYRLSVIYLRTGRAVQAVPLLEELIARDAGNPDYANTRALAYWHSGQKSRAVSSLKTLLQKHPHYAPARENLSRMLPRTLRQ